MTEDHITSLPATPATLRFAHRQLLTHAELLLDLPQEHNLTLGLLLAPTAARETAHRAGQHGLAQRYEISRDILRATTSARSRPGQQESA
jgi:hypothetical protein